MMNRRPCGNVRESPVQVGILGRAWMPALAQESLEHTNGFEYSIPSSKR